MLSRGLVPKGAIVTHLAGEATPDMAAFMRQLARLKHGQRVPLQYHLFNERHRQKTAILHIDHRWWAPQHPSTSCRVHDVSAWKLVGRAIVRLAYISSCGCILHPKSGNTSAILQGLFMDGLLRAVCLLCRYGEAQHWARDDAHGTWSSAEAVTSTVGADEHPKQQADLECTTTKAPVEADMDEVCSFPTSPM